MIVVLPIVMALGISIALFMLGMLGYLLFGFFKKLYHDLLHWHMPEDGGEQWSDGCSQHAICKYCGKEIMMDSQGNWF